MNSLLFCLISHVFFTEFLLTKFLNFANEESTRKFIPNGHIVAALFSNGYFLHEKTFIKWKKLFSHFFLVIQKVRTHCVPPRSSYIQKPSTIRVKKFYYDKYQTYKCQLKSSLDKANLCHSLCLLQSSWIDFYVQIILSKNSQ